MGPLKNLKVIEIGSIGPGPMCAMLLADLGASVLRIDRQEPSGLGVQRPRKYDLLLRNRPSVRMNLKEAAEQERLLDLVERADVLIEGFRPGVAERLGIGPDACLKRNARLVYGRMTGWGQEGPRSHVAGHDLNYIALTGALHAIGRKGQPPALPLNLVGDIGGGALYLAFGIMAALHESRFSGKGQVVDAAIVDGVASLMAQVQGTLGAGMMSHDRGSNITDSGAPFYDVYECADGRYVSFGAIEPKFYAEMLRRLALDPATLPEQWDQRRWPEMREKIAERVKTRSRDEWTAVFADSDACFAPVLTLSEAPDDPHLKARGTFLDIDGVMQPAPAPRFSRTRPEQPKPVNSWDEFSEDQLIEMWSGEFERTLVKAR